MYGKCRGQWDILFVAGAIAFTVVGCLAALLVLDVGWVIYFIQEILQPWISSIIPDTLEFIRNI